MYHITDDNCDNAYIGQMRRFLKNTFIEHRIMSLVKSEVSKHGNCDQPEHSITLDSVKILEVGSFREE